MKKNKNVSKGTKPPQPKMKARMSGVSKTAEKGVEVEIEEQAEVVGLSGSDAKDFIRDLLGENKDE